MEDELQSVPGHLSVQNQDSSGRQSGLVSARPGFVGRVSAGDDATGADDLVTVASEAATTTDASGENMRDSVVGNNGLDLRRAADGALIDDDVEAQSVHSLPSSIPDNIRQGRQSPEAYEMEISGDQTTGTNHIISDPDEMSTGSDQASMLSENNEANPDSEEEELEDASLGGVSAPATWNSVESSGNATVQSEDSASEGRSIVAELLEKDACKAGQASKAARAVFETPSLAEEAARREIVLDAIRTDLTPSARESVAPCVSLGGLSPVSFQVLFGTRAEAWLQQGSRATTELAARLQDQNEFLEDTHVYMTTFIERQKEKIESLEEEVRRLRRELQTCQQQPNSSSAAHGLALD
ncbi:Hypothetical Protein FCC1311_061972 [Hondaea fermentalgiana]|uniref:Uncharacterized protein n=1 Tax=Hondaea fermentalgiana TaxID=2315210 RepID=A0A2R5GGG7_9STRA|nr:Hypothetical Protein FCC1311_061972 [Hondaea fermentalgiana]|eukprot:GBG29977.1 Hypothetical Protein FCC1311_061972 [Hondaea fermentalgiana]